MSAVTQPADFNLLDEYHVLAVDGEVQPGRLAVAPGAIGTPFLPVPVPSAPPEATSETCDWGGCNEVTEHWHWGDFGSRWLPVCRQHADLMPPADLLALIGKACSACRGSGREFVNRELAGVNPERDRCQDCHGTGSELLTVKTNCECPCHTEPDPFAPTFAPPCDECTNGTRSLLVRLTGQPVPVVYGEMCRSPKPRHICIGDGWPDCTDGRTVARNVTSLHDNAGFIDLGPNPASLIGRWVWLPDALEVVRS